MDPLLVHDVSRLPVAITYSPTASHVPITSSGVLYRITPDNLAAGLTGNSDNQQMIGVEGAINFATGTWTTTRIAEANYVKRKTATAETSIISVDVTPMIRTAAGKGFQLNSFDYVYGIATANMVAHTVTLDKVSYANNTAVLITSVPVTGALATATQTNPYVTAVTVTTPAFDNTTDSKYVIEITANNASTTVYDFYGVCLKFSRAVY